MNALRKKMTSCRGETLVETMVALLVIVLSSGLLASMLLAANHLNATAIERDAALYAQMNEAQQQIDGTGTAGSVTVTDASNNRATYAVDYFGKDGALTSYRGETP